MTHNADGESSTSCRIAGSRRNISDRIGDWKPFAEVDSSLEEPAGGPVKTRWVEKEGEKGSMKSINLIHELVPKLVQTRVVDCSFYRD